MIMMMFSNTHTNLLSVTHTIHHRPTLIVLQSLGGNWRGYHMTLHATNMTTHGDHVIYMAH
jgi:hypothetical protein